MYIVNSLKLGELTEFFSFSFRIRIVAKKAIIISIILVSLQIETQNLEKQTALQCASILTLLCLLTSLKWTSCIPTSSIIEASSSILGVITLKAVQPCLNIPVIEKGKKTNLLFLIRITLGHFVMLDKPEAISQYTYHRINKQKKSSLPLHN